MSFHSLHLQPHVALVYLFLRNHGLEYLSRKANNVLADRSKYSILSLLRALAEVLTRLEMATRA